MVIHVAAGVVPRTTNRNRERVMGADALMLVEAGLMLAMPLVAAIALGLGLRELARLGASRPVPIPVRNRPGRRIDRA
ncbi:hypothetical protein PQJ75_03285 [Rhodoplanes sp. TEM]|nr:hypothetical protein [Rhodoplanes sp. TEM]